MPYGLYLSAAGANAQNHRLEVLSHNLANIDTPGFKPHLAILKSRHAAGIDQGETNPQDGTVDDVGGGIALQPSLTNFAQGPMQSTGNQTDFAINDTESFFVVRRDGDALLTRAGNFLFNSAGTLITPNGDPVLSNGGNPIAINPSQPFQVTPDGSIDQNGVRQTLGLVRPQEKGDLTRVGDNLFRPLTEVTQVPPAERQVASGFIEHSAVEPTMAMMELIEASRAFEANVKMIQSQDQAMGSLISRVLQQS